MKAPNPIPVADIAKLIWRYRNYISYAVQITLFYLHLKKQKPMKPQVKEFIDRIVKLFDDNTNTGFFEPFDAYALTKLLEVGWSLMEQKLPASQIELIELFIESIQGESDAALIEKLTPIINGKVDVPELNEVEEGKIIALILSAIALTLRGLLVKN